jgi:hypothetical protein
MKSPTNQAVLTRRKGLVQGRPLCHAQVLCLSNRVVVSSSVFVFVLTNLVYALWASRRKLLISGGSLFFLFISPERDCAQSASSFSSAHMARVSAAKADDQLVTFRWKNKSRELGTIAVPSGYKEETRASGESVRTTLKYEDGSYIVLHVGGVIKQPLFSEPDHQISEQRTLSQLVIREGKVRNTKLFWREQNSYGVSPATDTGFTNVPRDRFWLFMEALRSFRTAKQIGSAQADFATPASDTPIVPQPEPETTGLQQQKKIQTTITYCTPEIAKHWKLANLTFNSLYSFRINEKGEVIEITKLRDDFIGEEAVRSCLAKWRIVGVSGKSPFVVYFNWKHGKGWGEQQVSGNGFTQIMKIRDDGELEITRNPKE